MVRALQLRRNALRVRAGPKIKASSLEITVPVSAGTRFPFLITNPTKIHTNMVSIGVRVARNTSNTIIRLDLMNYGNHSPKDPGSQVENSGTEILENGQPAFPDCLFVVFPCAGGPGNAPDTPELAAELTAKVLPVVMAVGNEVRLHKEIGHEISQKETKDPGQIRSLGLYIVVG